ncbi:nucleoside recognition domain-containing protein [Anatilimnocola aggregata]|nr:nucleoside recognition domain-containing protein [Anatilimnocola aggregata]
MRSAQGSTVVVIGKESVGKSQLLASLTGCAASVGNFRGTTVSCDCYQCRGKTFVDTPGIVRQSDSETTRLALDRLQASEVVLLVAQATHLDDDLAEMLPLAAGKRGIVAVTFWDKVRQTSQVHEGLALLSRRSGLSIVPLDARAIDRGVREAVFAALEDSQAFPPSGTLPRVGWRVEPRAGIFEIPIIGTIVAAALLLIPAILAITTANWFAGITDAVVRSFLAPLVQWLNSSSVEGSLARAILAGDFGLFTMGPALFVWAAPTVLLYSAMLGAYKASGLIDRLDVALHPVARPLGLAGRDIIRVLMGFGCNVPAVISTRSCSNCSRGTCISAIAFGSACSYQLPAVLAVFSAIGQPQLTFAYLGYLFLTTCLYLRIFSPAVARSPLNQLLLSHRTFLSWPAPSSIWREMRLTIYQFFFRAMPIFVLISMATSILVWLNVLPWLAENLGHLLAAFRLPGEASLPIIMASLRKDGILLFLGGGSSASTPLTPLQALAGVYLASTLLPCLVTVWTIAREQSGKFAAWLVIRQAIAACTFTLVLVWAGYLLGW